MDSDKRELWDRLENESARAFNAFEAFLSLPSDERTLTAAYQRHVGNSAASPSDTWSRWSKEFAWRERAAAYDDYLASRRRDAFERGIEEEAERQGVLAERTRNRTNEMLTHSYEQAMEWFENASPTDLRPQDVIQIVRLHLDAVKAFGVPEKPRYEVWTDEDARDFIERITPELEAEDEADDTDKGREDFEDSDGC